MKRRLLSLVMAMLMLLTLLTACGEKAPAYENGEIDTKFDGMTLIKQTFHGTLFVELMEAHLYAIGAEMN